ASLQIAIRLFGQRILQYQRQRRTCRKGGSGKSARARMRVLVKRILRKHGYPPDLQDAAVQTVLRQAEALSSNWSF
ncbi:MAG: DUF3387 domain-containing protein, partial [Novosphingobium sp.]|nr:DUF3387 domain-containing protein [Novosphingobium sp.]